MAENISRFEHLSVREAQGAKLIKEICNKEAKVVLDPTLLLTANEWDTMAIPKNGNNPYILCYFLGTNKDNWSHAYELSKKTNIPLKIIPVFSSDYERGYDVVEGVGPGEFLSLVKNASMICTDSFHGTTFSIIYNKPFYTYERFSSKDGNSQNSRIYNILKQLDLESRLIKDTKNIPTTPLICEYTNSNKILELKRQESKNYLRTSLDEATNNNSRYDYTITNTCCGCGACSLVCPTNSIEIKRDKKGFLKAIVDQEKCIRCKKCRTVCPFGNNKSTDIDKDVHNLYMLKSNDKVILSTCSSGGAGHEIARYLSTEGYDVVGCAYDKYKMEAEHKLVSAGNLKSLNSFKGSKYIQSNTKNAFKEVIEKTNKAVFFGTPCQVAGIDLLLKSKNKRENYILIDLICHGVPSQHLWNKYIKEGFVQHGYGLYPNVEFRDKSRGWRNRFIHVEGNNQSYIRNESKDLFYRFFLLGHCYMEACYECNYRTRSSADLRIGDYWGPKYKDDKEGVSMVIAMSEVGEDILEKLKSTNRINLEKKECVEYWTVQYPENPIKPVFYNEIIRDLEDNNKSLEEIADFYYKGFEFNRRLQKVYSMMLSIMKKCRSNKQTL